MTQVVPSGQVLGATVEALDLSRPVSSHEIETLVQALGRHGVLRYPKQTLTASQLRDFAACFGELEVRIHRANPCNDRLVRQHFAPIPQYLPCQLTVEH